MCTNGMRPEVVSHLWKTMIQPILLYATQSLPLSKSDIGEMDKLQAKLIKSALQNVYKIANLRNIYTIDLLKNMFLADLKQ